MKTRRLFYSGNVWIILALIVLIPQKLMGQETILLKQKAFPNTVPAGNYSGITWMGGSQYAVANDKSPTTGFYLMTIDIDSISGELLSVRLDTFLTCGQPTRDEEGVCYMPQNQTIFVSGERDQEIIEFDLKGQLTGRRLNIPEVFKTAYSNRGFEALTYQQKTHRFWTTSENTLQADGDKPDIGKKIKNRLRFQSFGDDLQPKEQYWYETDSAIVKKRKGTSIMGVGGLAALENGRIVVLERELYFPKKQIGSYCLVKLYIVDPGKHKPGEQLSKTLLTTFRTKVNLTRQNFANYEGICAGPKLADGRQLLLLICDSQNQYRGVMKDWFKPVILPSSD